MRSFFSFNRAEVVRGSFKQTRTTDTRYAAVRRRGMDTSRDNQ